MALIQWRDVTYYSRDGDRVPHWWAIKLGRLRLSVGNQHVYYPDGKTWLATCAPFFEVKVLSGKTEEEAKTEALNLVREFITEVQSALESI